MVHVTDILQASTVTGYTRKHRFSHRGGLLMLVKACLSTVKVSKHCFTHRRSLVKLVQACLSTVKVRKRSVYHCRSLLKLMQTGDIQTDKLVSHQAEAESY